MAKSPKKPDSNEIAKSVVDRATGAKGATIFERVTGEKRKFVDTPQKAEEKNPAAVALGRLGGKKGGPARAEALTPEERSAIAKKAAEARWKKDL